MIDRPWHLRTLRSVFRIQAVNIDALSHPGSIRISPCNDEDRSGNCSAGFVAAKGTTSPIGRDFYLLSHAGILKSR